MINPNETHIMLDLETMGTAPDAAIVALGAVRLGPDLDNPANCFYRRVDLQSALDTGGTVSGDTIRWWMQQSPEATAEITADPCTIGSDHIHAVLEDFGGWIGWKHPRDVFLWGNGSSFDCVILRTAFCRHPHGDDPTPWAPRNERCYRTLRAAIGNRVPPPEFVGIRHHALDDARHQARHLMRLLAMPLLGRLVAPALD